MKKHKKIRQGIRTILRLLIGIFILFVTFSIGIIYLVYNPDSFSSQKTSENSDYVPVPQGAEFNKIENGIHLRTGLVEAEGLTEVVNNCTNCHSASLVIQNRMNKEQWVATIRWMQETQNLWDLGNNEDIIINYLVTNYPAKEKGRRQGLTNIEWYELHE